MEISFSVSQKLPAVQDFKAAIRSGLDGAMLALEASAVDAATSIIYAKPERGYRRTGLYRGSLGRGHHMNIWKNDGTTATFGSRVHYAPYLEFGTSRMAPRAVLRTALANTGAILTGFVTGFRNALGR